MGKKRLQYFQGLNKEVRVVITYTLPVLTDRGDDVQILMCGWFVRYGGDVVILIGINIQLQWF